MNRRNFLKLFGIGLLPLPALAAASPAPTVETTVEPTAKKEWLILETPYMGMHTVEIADDENIHDSYMLDNETTRFYRVGFTTRQFLNVTEQSLVTVTAPDGQSVWFHPVWNTVDERFETVSIETETCHDIFLSDDGDAVHGESKYTTMTARLSDGELVGKTIQDIV